MDDEKDEEIVEDEFCCSSEFTGVGVGVDVVGVEDEDDEDVGDNDCEDTEFVTVNNGDGVSEIVSTFETGISSLDVIPCEAGVGVV